MFGHPSSFPLLLNERDAVEDLWYQMVKMMLFDCSCSFSSGLVLMLFFFYQNNIISLIKNPLKYNFNKKLN